MPKYRNQILGYGEDALTLAYLQNQGKRRTLSKAIRKELGTIGKLSLRSDKCEIYYRPSFGRAYTGEPDFIIFAKTEDNSIGYWIVGESKWDNSSEYKKDGRIAIKNNQEIMRIKKLEALRRYWDFTRKNGIPNDRQYSNKIGRALGVKSQNMKGTILFSNVRDFLKRATKYFGKYTEVAILPLLVVFVKKGQKKAYVGKKSKMAVVTIKYTQDDAYVKLGYVT